MIHAVSEVSTVIIPCDASPGAATGDETIPHKLSATPSDAPFAVDDLSGHGAADELSGVDPQATDYSGDVPCERRQNFSREGKHNQFLEHESLPDTTGRRAEDAFDFGELNFPAFDVGRKMLKPLGKATAEHETSDSSDQGTYECGPSSHGHAYFGELKPLDDATAEQETSDSSDQGTYECRPSSRGQPCPEPSPRLEAAQCSDAFVPDAVFSLKSDEESERSSQVDDGLWLAVQELMKRQQAVEEREEQRSKDRAAEMALRAQEQERTSQAEEKMRLAVEGLMKRQLALKEREEQCNKDNEKRQAEEERRRAAEKALRAQDRERFFEKCQAEEERRQAAEKALRDQERERASQAEEKRRLALEGLMKRQLAVREREEQIVRDDFRRLAEAQERRAAARTLRAQREIAISPSLDGSH